MDISNTENDLYTYTVNGVKYQLYNSIIEENKKKYKPEEMTIDFLPTIETQLKEIEEDEKNYSIEDNDKNFKREMTQRVKCLSLLKMNLSPLTNVFDLRFNQRDELQKLMHEYNEKSFDDIINEFNEKVGSTLFESNDYEKFPLYRCI